MPRSIKRPQTGSVVWYYADATSLTAPLAAMVIKSRTDLSRYNNFDLAVFAAAGNALTAALGVLFTDGSSRPATGAFCTYMRDYENLAGKWPKDQGPENPLGPGGVVV